MKLIKLLFTAVFLCAGMWLTTTSAQGGMSVYSGISAAFSQDQNITPSGFGHYGYFVGADFRLHSGDLYFAGGGRYYFTSLLAEESASFFRNADTYRYISARFGFGFNIKHFSYNTRLRSKVFGVFNFAGEAPDNMIDTPGYQRLNDSSGGIVTGLGLDVGAVTLDLEYQFGLINAFRNQQDSKFDVMSLAVGFFF
jgi:hypothetical protein